MQENQHISLFNRILGYATALSIVVYLTWRLFYTLPVNYGYVSLAFGLLLFVCELLSGIQAITNYLDQIRPFPLERPDIPDSSYPDVDILIATHDEEVDLMYNTLNACQYLDYPDKSKVHVYLCDDGNRPEMRELAKRCNAHYIDMPVPKHAKAGNMNNALAQTTSPLIAFLDADMIPRKHFLTTLVPYFLLPKFKKVKGEWVERAPEEIDPDYKIGFVQSPQNFYNPDLFQYNLYAENRIPNEQIYFFREINVSRNRHNATLLCGSNMMMSREALESVGYFSTDSITEDCETGIKVQTAGYTTYAIADCLANGLNPPAVVNLLVQRERWGRGCMQTFHNLRPFTDSRIPLLRRFHYLCSLFYWLTFFSRFVFIMSPILVALFGVFIMECSLGEILLFWLPYYILHTFAMSRISAKTRTVNWCNTVDTIMFPFLVMPILLDMLGFRLKHFRVTDKSHQVQTSPDPAMALPHIIMFILSVVGIALSLIDIIQYRALYNIIILFWLIVNAKSLLLSIFFMLGRVNERYFYRFSVNLPVEVEVRGVLYRGTTTDISEGGFAVDMNFPVYIDADETVTTHMYDRDYQTTLKCKIVQIRRTDYSDWEYSMKVLGADEHALSQYRQMIYERDPTLPEAVVETIPVVEDLKVNFDKRLAKPVRYFSRMLPRIIQTIDGHLPNGAQVAVHDFSYRYVQITPLKQLRENETTTVALAPGIEIVLKSPGQQLAAQNHNLFAVANWEQWTSDEKYLAFLSQWAVRKTKPKVHPPPLKRRTTVAKLRSLSSILRRIASGNAGHTG